MDDGKGMKNQSMLRDLRSSQGELTRRRFQTNHLDLNVAPPAGHVFSVVIETIGIESDFIKFMDELYGIKGERMGFAESVRFYNPMRTFTHFEELRDYILRRGVSKKDYKIILFAALGYEDDELLDNYYPFR